MKFELPEKASEETIHIDVREIEAMLQGPAMDLPKWPGAQVKLKDGRILYIREARREDLDHFGCPARRSFGLILRESGDCR